MNKPNALTPRIYVPDVPVIAEIEIRALESTKKFVSPWGSIIKEI